MAIEDAKLHELGHIPWQFAEQSLVWVDRRPVGINFFPKATELFEWMKRDRLHLSIQRPNPRQTEPDATTNPYTPHVSTLATMLTIIENEAYDFFSSNEALSPLQAEIMRVRISNDVSLYAARFCECAIKQLLHLTSLKPKVYKDSALHGLLETDCKPCRRAKRPHAFSLLTSLAHPYKLCHEFEGCVLVHLRLVNRRRNAEAAHAETLLLNPTTVEASRAELKKFSLEALEDLHHMLSHLKDLEERIADDLEAKAKQFILGNKVSRSPQMQWESLNQRRTRSAPG